MPLPEKSPRMLIRCSTISAISFLLVALGAVAEFQTARVANVWILLAASAGACALVIPSIFEMWRLEEKRENKLKSALLLAGSACASYGLLKLNEMGLFVWNVSYLILPLLLVCALYFVGSLVAERRHARRIYVSLDGFHFVER
jgi:hypothetical protein